MKPLVFAVLSTFLLLPAALQAQVKRDASDSLKELKKKYSNGGQKPELDAPKSAPEAAKLGALPPAMYARYAKGPNGYTLKELVENLNWTEKNIAGLLDYINPWQKGTAPAEGDELAAAQKTLALESAAAKALIADADAALAKGIPRDPKDSKDYGLERIGSFLSRPSLAYVNPTPEQQLQNVAAAQCNVLGHSAALIEYKRLNPGGKGEWDTEQWLAAARNSLAAAEQRAH